MSTLDLGGPGLDPALGPDDLAADGDTSGSAETEAPSTDAYPNVGR